MQVKIDIRDKRITIEKNNQTDDVSNSIFVVQFPVLKGATCIKTVNVIEPANRLSHTCDFENNIFAQIKSILLNRCFMLVVLGTLKAIPYNIVIIIYLGDMYKDNGLTNDDVSFGLLLLNIFNIFGRLLLGILLHSRHLPTLLVPLLSSLLSVVLLLFLAFVKTRTPILTLTAFFGVPIGMSASVITVLTLKLIDAKLFPIAVGIFYTLNGIGNLVIGPLNGKKRIIKLIIY